MEGITCVTCYMTFSSYDEQRQHFQTEFHRENTRREVNKEPPMTQHEYLEYLQHMKEKEQEELQKKRKVYKCIACSKEFASENSFKEHLSSLKHKHMASELENNCKYNELTQMSRKEQIPNHSGEEEAEIVYTEANIQVEPSERLPAFLSPDEYEIFKALLPELDELDEESEDALITKEIFDKRKRLKPSSCLYCEFAVGDDLYESHEEMLELLVAHMWEHHSFMIPEKQYVKNMGDLIAELQKQVAVARCCLVCLKGFRSVELCQRHMRNTGHTTFDPRDFPEQFIDFYDFTTSYPAEFLAMAKQDGDEEVLKAIQQTKYYLRLDDLTYKIDGEDATFLEWREWKRYHVPKWLKLLHEQNKLVLRLRALKGDIYQNKPHVASEPTTGSTSVTLRSEAESIVDQVNAIASELPDSKHLIHITSDNIAKYALGHNHQEERLIVQQNKLMLDNKKQVRTEINEQINMFKKYFKRQTMVWLRVQ